MISLCGGGRYLAGRVKLPSKLTHAVTVAGVLCFPFLFCEGVSSKTRASGHAYDICVISSLQV